MSSLKDFETQKQAAVSKISDFFDLLSKKWEAHENFMHDGVLPSPEIISPDILDSWKISIKSGLKSDVVEPIYLNEMDFSLLLINDRDLINAADPVLNELSSQLNDQLFSVDLYDRSLCLLKRYNVSPDSARRWPHMRPGLMRSEESAGANAMSMSLKRNCTTQMFGGDHFLDNMGDRICTSSPIVFDGETVGAINVLSSRIVPDDNIPETVSTMVKLIENNYQQQKLRHRIADEAALSDTIINESDNGILLISPSGVISRSNSVIEKICGKPGNELKGRALSEIFGSGNPLSLALTDSSPITDREIALDTNGINRRFIATVKRIASNDINDKHELAGYLITLKDMTSAKRMLRSVNGWNARYTFDDIIGDDPLFAHSVNFARDTASMNSNTLIEGETGTGKELFAQAIHNASSFAHGPFVSVNCGSIPMTLLESELFGYESGSFTGAKKSGQMGKFELAEGGTIFLDEINSIPMEMQVKLLRVLQEKKVCRIGSNTNIDLHIRVIAASNENLWNLVQEGKFRADLFYRLNVITIQIPPLRLHPDDIPLIIDNMLSNLSAGESISISDEALSTLKSGMWPGNVRELENTIERALINVRLRGSGCITTEDLAPFISSTQSNHQVKLMAGSDAYVSYHNQNAAYGAITPGLNPSAFTYDQSSPLYAQRVNDFVSIPVASSSGSIQKAEKEIISEALRKNNLNISATARELGMARNTLYSKIKKYGIKIL